MSQLRERKEIESLFKKLNQRPKTLFPKARERFRVTEKQGVYVIRDPRQRVVHVGRTQRAKHGLRQRLKNHLHGLSSFTHEYLRKDGSKLRGKYTFQFFEVRNERRRALLEYFATARLCPLHLGVGGEGIAKSVE
jgi:hypothetical protein